MYNNKTGNLFYILVDNGQKAKFGDKESSDVATSTECFTKQEWHIQCATPQEQ